MAYQNLNDTIKVMRVIVLMSLIINNKISSTY